ARTGSGAVEKPVRRLKFRDGNCFDHSFAGTFLAISSRFPVLYFAFFPAGQARRGNLRASLLSDADRVFWTRTMWTTEEAMNSFMLSGAHRQVMPRLLNWCNEAAPGPLGAGEPENA